MFYLLTYYTVEDYIKRRAPFRNTHLSLAKEYFDKGLLVMGGALANPADKALLVFKCDDKNRIEEFVKRDPYVQNGLVASWDIREWTVVIGDKFQG